LVLAPHPDDETLGAGGLIHHYGQRRLRVTIVSVTDGEAACPEIDDLARIRRRELGLALDMLSAADARIIRLGLPDGHVGEHRTELSAALRSIAAPDCLWVAPFEHDGHPDHDIVGATARQVAGEHGAALIAYPIWAWPHATPEIFAGRRLARLDLDARARAAKLAACRCHVSQLRERPGGPIVPPEVLAWFQKPYETYVL
jgi:LmbE family N-acetylglucosaminyl deacetylase